MRFHLLEERTYKSVAAQGVRRWQQYTDETTKTERSAVGTAEMLASEGRSLTVRLEQSEMTHRAGLDHEWREAFDVGARAWAVCLEKLRADWSPWATAAAAAAGAGGGGGAISGHAASPVIGGGGYSPGVHGTGLAGGTNSNRNATITWRLSDCEDEMGRKLLLIKGPRMNFANKAWRVETTPVKKSSTITTTAAAAAAEETETNANATNAGTSSASDPSTPNNKEGGLVVHSQEGLTSSSVALQTVAKARVDPSRMHSHSIDYEGEHDDDEEDFPEDDDKDDADRNSVPRGSESQNSAVSAVKSSPNGTGSNDDDDDDYEEGFEALLLQSRAQLDAAAAAKRAVAVLEHAPGERSVRTMEVQVVRPESVTVGRLVLTTMSLYFHPAAKQPHKGGDEDNDDGNGATGAEGGGGTDAHNDSKRKASAGTHQGDQRWRLGTLTAVYGRRYLLRPDCAMELFFANAPALFLVFRDATRRQRLWADLKTLRAHGGGSSHSGSSLMSSSSSASASSSSLSGGSSRSSSSSSSRGHSHAAFPLLQAPEVLQSFSASTRNGLNPRACLSRSGLTTEWQQRRISNFEYLMKLNFLAGRSRNDVTQYPVFPWILADYTSDTLDLENPNTFRDLRKPIGALQPERLEAFQERYECFDDPYVPKFMYGSHYSSAGTVLHFLVRQEPYTSMAVNLHDGRFDCPDRLFQSIESAWESCNQSMTDVKELIPELFYDPEVLLNTNALPLGTLQSGVEVGDVQLPPWAKGSAHEFIRLHRQALESEYVSANLHHWIDLVFGYKQVGEEAVKANNLFYYLTYEGAVDLEKIEDPMLRDATAAQIKHFGQTPSQLLTRPHPARDASEACPACPTSADARVHKLESYAIPDLKLSGLSTDSSKAAAAAAAASSGGSSASSGGANSSSSVTGNLASATYNLSSTRIGASSSVSSIMFSGRRKVVVVTSDRHVSHFVWSSAPSTVGGRTLPYTLKPARPFAKPLPCRSLAVVTEKAAAHRFESVRWRTALPPPPTSSTPPPAALAAASTQETEGTTTVSGWESSPVEVPAEGMRVCQQSRHQQEKELHLQIMQFQATMTAKA